MATEMNVNAEVYLRQLFMSTHLQWPPCYVQVCLHCTACVFHRLFWRVPGELQFYLRRRAGILDEAICSLVDTRRLCKSFRKATALDIPIFSDCLPFRALLGWRIVFSRGSNIEIEIFSFWQLLLSGICLC